MPRGILAGLSLVVALTCGVSPAQERHPSGLRDVVDPKGAAPAAPEAADPNAPPAELAPAAPADPTTALMRKVAQLMVVTLEGVNAPTTLDRQVLTTLPPGAVIVPRINDPEGVADYVHNIRGMAANAFEQLPFLIGADLFAQERYMKEARVVPLRVPAMIDFAAAGVSETTAGVFALIADDMYAMGFDFHLGPSLALANMQTNRMGLAFSFGSDAMVSANLARQFDEAMRARGVAWMPMGYPGGSGWPPMLLTPRAMLRERDLLPYAGVAQGPNAVRLLNVGTSLVPMIDDSLPACLSSIVVHDLRNDVLSYSGLVVAGPLDSKEITLAHRPEKAAIEALVSGADMLYWAAPGPHVVQAAAAIVDGIQKGGIDEKIIDTALDHIRAFKKAQPEPREFKDIQKDARDLVKKRENATEPIELGRRAITLVKNESGILPLSEASQPLAVVSAWGAEELKDALEEFVEPVAARPIRMAKVSSRFEDFETSRIIKITDTYRTIVIVVSNELEAPGQRNLIRSFRQLGRNVVAVVVGFPTDLTPFEDANAIIVAYGNTNRVGDTIVAVADILMGNAPIDILPPLRDLQLRTGEETTFNAYDVMHSPVGRLPIPLKSPYIAGYSVAYRPTLSVDTARWDFGDGTKTSGLQTTHQYKKPGVYQVVLTVRGKKKDKDSATGVFQVNVQ